MPLGNKPQKYDKQQTRELFLVVVAAVETRENKISILEVTSKTPLSYWLFASLQFNLFRSGTSEKNRAFFPLTRFLQVRDHWSFSSTAFLQLLPKTRLMNRCAGNRDRATTRIDKNDALPTQNIPTISMSSSSEITSGFF
jgi:hypothetical protein